jgi:hypothetical protein
MSDDVFIPLFAIGMPILLALSIVAIKHRARHREMRHREQMRALELGLAPAAGAAPGAAMVCAAIGAGVPVAACFFAMLTTVTARDAEVAAIAWPIAMIVGVGGLICGYRLAIRLLVADGAATAGRYAPTGAGLATSKDVTDPDLYDVVGRRG